MVERIRRNRPAGKNTTRVEELMKSISIAQDEAAAASTTIASLIPALYAEMKTLGLSEHQVDGVVAQVFRPSGRTSNVIDPQGFRKLVKDDKAFFGAISVSVAKAKEVLPGKQLLTITTTKEAVPGEETVRVRSLL